MIKDGSIFIGKSENREIYLNPSMANRHGIIAGATGTGKTVTMKVLAESFSDIGVPVFFSDVKGDLSGMCKPGEASENVNSRIQTMNIDDFSFKAYPTRFWDVFGESGHPVRVTVSSLSPMLLGRLLNLSDVQVGVLNIVYKAADDQGLLLLDLKDLRAMLQYVSENKEEYTSMYGNVSPASIGAIQRALLAFEQEGGECIFGEPALDIRDWIRTDSDGRGFINILSSQKLIQSPTVYSMFLLWMMTELYEKLPEVGDPDKPRVVFFFDEAHFLFTDTPKSLVQKIEQVIKLIRSKGVGIFFVTQNPSDIPDSVLAQLSNRVQHALRAYTPAEQKSVRAAAGAFRTNESFDTEKALMALEKGEALVSFLDEKGIPEIVEKTLVVPPQSLMGPASEDEVKNLILQDEFELKYRETIDRESAYEIIERAKAQLAAAYQEAVIPAVQPKEEVVTAENENLTQKMQRQLREQKQKQSKASKTAQQAVTAAGSSVARSLSTNMINTITGSKVTKTETIAKRAATSALSSVMRSGTTSLIRGLFGNLK